MTVADYGDILLTENPANGALNLQVLETNTYRGWNYAYDAIGGRPNSGGDLKITS